MSLHPLAPEIVAETNAWFYALHPRGQKLRGPNGDTPLHPTSAEDAEGRRAWVAEYRRRMAEKQAKGGNAPSEDEDLDDRIDPLSSILCCCPTDFTLAPEFMTLEAEESALLYATDMPPAGFGAGTYTWTTFGAGTYTWTTTSDKLSLEEASMPGLQVAEGAQVWIRAGTEPNTMVEAEPGELVEVTRTQPGCAPITKQAWVFVQKCKEFRLRQPKIIAIATASYLTPTTTFADPGLPGGHALSFGQDLSFSTSRALPQGSPSVGTTTASLENTMRRLLIIFASNMFRFPWNDRSDMAEQLFDAFLTPQRAVEFWSNEDLTAAAEAHPNIASFVSRALSAPNSRERSEGRTRIHQALENAGWDINKAVPPTDLGVPAFNRGTDWLQTRDFDNGLALMVNAIQHGIVVAKDYYYDRCKGEYFIKLEYVFYDVFGLDDDDLREFGADGGIDTDAAAGITAWWQLQHQHGYAPLITRIAFEREFRFPVS
ncbi:MAG: hypothetical protein LGR52_15945 [Candidatus Thiosymbion ectosymbiont of Robbea hypermnestra]|nr:hypothetical protein [Candidatus Thiosymbion ectosymbiont of Robbea hypermnestra]